MTAKAHLASAEGGYWLPLMTRIILVLFVAAGASLTACSSGGSTVSRSRLASGYLTQTGGVAFFHLRRHGNDFDGSAQRAMIEGEPPYARVRELSGSVSGTINGSRMTLETTGIEDQCATSSPCSGQFSPSTLTLNVPQSDGTLGAVEFRAATTTDYNNAVSQLNAQLAQANQTESGR
jgi:hypothetical protein